MAIAMLATSVAGFLPSLIHPAERRAPVSPLAAAHGVVFLLWLLVFLVQSRLIATRHVGWHRRLGLAAAFLLAAMIPLGYSVSINMVRRGFDLSGDLKVDRLAHDGYSDPEVGFLFPFTDLVLFSGLAVAALAYRRKPEIHRRLMLFANIALMPAPLAHFIGHTPFLFKLQQPAIVLIPIFFFLSAAVLRDYVVNRRVHPLTWSLAVAMFVSGPLRAGLLGPSAAWHRFVDWLAR
jgi:hypothetical protein